MPPKSTPQPARPAVRADAAPPNGTASASPPPPQRPQRLALHGEDGRRCTLASGSEAFVRLDAQKDAPVRGALVLGLGPEAGRALAHGPLAGCTDVLWLECGAFMQGLDVQETGWATRIPTDWQSLTAQEETQGKATPGGGGAACSAGVACPAEAARAAAHCARNRRVYWHTQNMRLFPAFWGPVLGAVQAALLGLLPAHGVSRSHAAAGTVARPQTVFLPGDATALLHKELTEAFAAEGFTVCAPQDSAQHGGNGGVSGGGNGGHGLHTLLRAHLREDRPALFFSVNGRGLDAQGVDFALLRACGVPVALWLVDNPWHILSAWRQPWWREAHIFVTDQSFIPDLQKNGAAHVHHLPLAVAQHMWADRHTAMQPPAGHGTAGALVHFVGRASFPAKDAFFAAARVPQPLMDRAREQLNTDTLPDFHWWARHLDTTLWPGFDVRNAGLGAERCAALRRAQWLAAALGLGRMPGLAIHGDSDGWRALLPHAPESVFHPAVDYYGGLPRVYAEAPYSLNVTSLLLPAGLTQRHFDVWAAGGFLLSDATPGLGIFPDDLTRHMCLAGPQALPAAVEALERDPALRPHLQTAWRTHLRAGHTYAHRVCTVLEALGL